MRRIGPPRQVSKARYCCAGPASFRNISARRTWAFWNGWLQTGDLGRVDEDGYLYVVGRKKEVIKRGGHSVFPLEIDNVMITHPAVAEGITFAIPHDTLGEDVSLPWLGSLGTSWIPPQSSNMSRKR